ncbi:hydrolase [Longimycelium tulufanense]|uniref:Hydrolase n=1 Tax=Longimycelium tulufanense TaxID=907463 RepID=A0A8J3CEB7_9PSEU|nr:hydrolase [Longimycelium tulufanense]
MAVRCSMRRTVRGVLAGALTLAVAFAVPGTGAAVPPPPPNPSDSEIDAGHAEVEATARRVGELTNRLAEAEARLQQLVDEVAYKMEQASKALVDLERAEAAARRAAEDARAARREADAADSAIEQARKRLDEFAAASYRQGSTVGSITGFLGVSGPKDLLDRAEMLDLVSRSQLDVLDDLERARVHKTNKDSLARKALENAQAKRAAAEAAKRAADAAKAAAIQARSQQQRQTERIENTKAEVERELAEARENVAALEGQRRRYEEWLEAKRREEEEARRRAAEAAAAAAAAAAAQNRPVPAGSPVPGISGRGNIETVIGRAMSQLGVQYAWGGGNAYGPTLGIRDGGVADAFGDYAKVGFDCSGLMVYAFAGAGVPLPKYSGYQYNTGMRVPLSQVRRGDMLFWGPNGGTHVALYLGSGMMVEAPYSGGVVRVSSVRYGGIQPYAVRIL